MAAPIRTFGVILALALAAASAVPPPSARAADAKHKPWWAEGNLPKAPSSIQFSDQPAPTLALGPAPAAKAQRPHAPLPAEPLRPDRVAAWGHPQPHRDPSLDQPPAPQAAPRVDVDVKALPRPSEAVPATAAVTAAPTATAAPIPATVISAPAPEPSPQRGNGPIPLAIAGAAGVLTLIAAAFALLRRRGPLGRPSPDGEATAAEGGSAP